MGCWAGRGSCLVAKTGLSKPLGASQELALHAVLLVNTSKALGCVSMACPWLSKMPKL